MKIVIVGGGTAGWLAALMISKRTQHSVTVVESDRIDIIGAGEGSTGIFTDIIENNGHDYGCNREDFIEFCSATPKYGIKFKNWTNDPAYNYISPLDITATANDDIDIVFLAALKFLDHDKTHTVTTCGNAIEHDIRIPPPNAAYVNPAYHFDARKVGRYFQKICTTVTHEIADVVDVVIDQKITKLRLSNNKIIEGDFFIDATGFSRVLLSKLNAKWKSYKENLPVNCAIPFLLPKDEQPNLYTTAWAQSSGWMWQIPTLERKGCGYVFSDEFITPENAISEIETVLGQEIDPIKVIKFDSGRLEDVWIENCLAIGLSSSFAEPLQATSIHTTIIQLEHFIDGWLRHNLETTMQNRESYNKIIAKMYDSMRDFLVLHYQSGRSDTEFWRYVNSGETLTDFTRDILELAKIRMPNRTLFQSVPGVVDWGLWSFILSGLKLIPQSVVEKELKYRSIDVDYLKHIFDFSQQQITGGQYGS